MHHTQPPYAFGSGGWWVLTLGEDKMKKKQRDRYLEKNGLLFGMGN